MCVTYPEPELVFGNVWMVRSSPANAPVVEPSKRMWVASVYVADTWMEPDKMDLAPSVNSIWM